MLDKRSEKNDGSETMSLPSDQDSTGRTLGKEEIANLARAIESGTLTSTKGKFTKQFETRFADLVKAKYAYACASGTAAVHIGIAAINPEPGDEIITTSITDMGALTPILYQGAIPVFADVDPDTCNVTAKTIEACLSDRTKAIIVTHLFGNPCDMNAIMALAKDRGIAVIEDTAQAFLASVDGKYVGTIGDVGAFSLQQGKHITTGEGGIVVSNNDALARHSFLYINKAWGYGDPKPDHYFLALNYRMSELQGAVADAQLDKLEEVVERRIDAANRLTSAIEDLEGISTPKVLEGHRHVYWKYCVMVDDKIIEGGSPGLGAFLRERNIASAPRYIQKPAFRCQVLADQVTFGNSRWPFTLARPEAVDYSEERFPATFSALRRILVLPWNELYEEAHVDFIAQALRDGVQQLTRSRS